MIVNISLFWLIFRLLRFLLRFFKFFYLRLLRLIFFSFPIILLLLLLFLFFINFKIVVLFIIRILLLIIFTGFNKVRKRIFAFYAPYPFAIKSGVIGFLIYLLSLVDDIDLYRRKRKSFGIISYLMALSFSLYRI